MTALPGANPPPPATPDPGRSALNSFLRSLDQVAATHEIENIESKNPPKVSTASLRRRRRSSEILEGEAMATLMVKDDVVRWQFNAGPPPAGRGNAAVRRAGRRALRRGGWSWLTGADEQAEDPDPGEVASQFRFNRLPPNKILDYIAGVDARLSPKQSLYELTRTAAGWSWREVAGPKPAGKLLVFIHGTFSSPDMYLSEIPMSQEGRAFLDDAAQEYDQVLAFGHQTLAVSPMVNAVDLAMLFAGSKADLDVVAHSRGGVVTRWWLDGAGRVGGGKRRAMLVGSPLGGTSLASPDRVRHTMNLLSNVGKTLGAVGTAASVVAPFLQIPLMLLKVVSSVTGFMGQTPISDAIIALIPGLHGQSRVGNNAELRRLLRIPSSVQYGFVRSNFEPTDPGWKFWEYFRGVGGRAADFGADIVFPARNDLVVDSISMIDLDGSKVPAPEQDVDAADNWNGPGHNFGTNPKVHHINYFQQPETIRAIRELFDL